MNIFCKSHGCSLGTRLTTDFSNQNQILVAQMTATFSKRSAELVCMQLSNVTLMQRWKNSGTIIKYAVHRLKDAGLLGGSRAQQTGTPQTALLTHSQQEAVCADGVTHPVAQKMATASGSSIAYHETRVAARVMVQVNT